MFVAEGACSENFGYTLRIPNAFLRFDRHQIMFWHIAKCYLARAPRVERIFSGGMVLKVEAAHMLESSGKVPLSISKLEASPGQAGLQRAAPHSS